MSGIGHNGGPSFDDVVRENLERGFLLVIKEVIVQAIRDPRLDRRHLRVLAEVIDFLNSSSMTAYPGRKKLTEQASVHHVQKPYTEPGIAKTISELITFGYLISTKRQGEPGGRALSHYTIRKPTQEELQDEITAFITMQRATPKSSRYASATKADVTCVGNVTSVGEPVGNVTRVPVVRVADVTPVGDVTRPDVTPVGNVTCGGNVTSDVTYVVPTVTSLKELVIYASPREREPAQKLQIDIIDNLAEKLYQAGGAGLANPAGASGLLHIGVPMMWLESGADLERDVLPTVTALCAANVAKGNRPINNWKYFTNAISDAKAAREAGLPPPSLSRGRGNGTGEQTPSKWARMAEPVMKGRKP